MTMSSRMTHPLVAIVLLLGGTVPTESFPVNVVRGGADGRLSYHVTRRSRPDNDDAASSAAPDVVRGRGPLRPASPPPSSHPQRVDKRRAAVAPLKMLVVGEAVLAAVFAAGAAVGSGLANLFADDDGDGGEEDDGADSAGEGGRPEEEKEEEVLVVDEVLVSPQQADVDLTVRNGEEEGAGKETALSSVATGVDVDVDTDVDTDEENAIVVEAGVVESSSSSSSEDVDILHLEGVEEASELLGGDIMHQIISEEAALIAHTPASDTVKNIEPSPRMVATTTMDPPSTIASPGVGTTGIVSVSGDDDSSYSYVDPSLSDLCYLSSSSDSCPDVGPGLSGDPFGGSSSGSGTSGSGDTRDGHVDGAIAGANAGSGSSGSGRGHLFADEPDLISPVVSSASSENFGIRRKEGNNGAAAANSRGNGNEANNASTTTPPPRTVRKVNGSTTTTTPHNDRDKEANGWKTTPPRVVRNGAADDDANDTAKKKDTTGDLPLPAKTATTTRDEDDEVVAVVPSSSSSSSSSATTEEVTTRPPPPTPPIIMDDAEIGAADHPVGEDGRHSKGGDDDDSVSAVVGGGGEEDRKLSSTGGVGSGGEHDVPAAASGTKIAITDVGGEADDAKKREGPSEKIDFGSAGIATSAENENNASSAVGEVDGREESQVAPSSSKEAREKLISAATTEEEEEEGKEEGSDRGGPPATSGVEGKMGASASSSAGGEGSSSSSAAAATAAKEEVVASAAAGVEGGLRRRGVDDTSSSSKEEEAKSTTTEMTKKGKVSTPTGGGEERGVVVVASNEGDPPPVTMEEMIPSSSATTGKTEASAAAPGEEGAINSTRVTSSAGAKVETSAPGKVEDEKEPSVGGTMEASTAPGEEGAVRLSTKAASSAEAEKTTSTHGKEEEEKVPVVKAKTKASSAPGEEVGAEADPSKVATAGATEDASLGAKAREGAEPKHATGGGEGLVVESRDAPTAEANEKVSTAAAEGAGVVGASKTVDEKVVPAAAANGGEEDAVGVISEKDASMTSYPGTASAGAKEDGVVGAAAKRGRSMMGKEANSKKKKKEMPDAVEREKMQASEEKGPIADVGGNKFTTVAGKDRVGASKECPSVTNGEKMADAAKEELVDYRRKELYTKTGKKRVSSTNDEEYVVDESMEAPLGASTKEVSRAAEGERDENIAPKEDLSAAIEEGTSSTAKMDVGPSTEAASAKAEDVASVAVKGQDPKGRKKAASAKTKEDDVSTAGKSGEAPSPQAGATASTAAKVKADTSKEDGSVSMKERVSSPANGKELVAKSWEEEAGAVGEDPSAMSDGAKSKKTSPRTKIEHVSASKEDTSAKVHDESAAPKLVVSTDDLLATIGGKVAAAAREEEARSSKEGTIVKSKEQASATLKEDEEVAPMETRFDIRNQQLSAEVPAYQKEPLAEIEEIETARGEEATVKEFPAAKSSKDTSTMAEKTEVVDFLEDDPSPLTKEPVAATEKEETSEAPSARTNIEPAATIKNEEIDDSKEAQSATTTEKAAMSVEEIKAIKAEIEDLKGTLKSKRLEASRLEHEADDFSKAGYLRKRGETNDARKRMGVASANDKYLARTLVVQEFLPVFDDLDDLVDSPLAKSDFAQQYAIPTLLFGLKAKLAELDVTEYGRSSDEGEIIGGKIDLRRFAIVGEEFSNDVPHGSVLRVVRSGMEIKGNVVRLAECVVSRGAEDLPILAPVTPHVAPRVTKPTSIGTRRSASSASAEPVSLFEQRMRSWHGQDFDNTSSEDPGSDAMSDASASDFGGASDSGSGPNSKPSLHIWSGPSGSSGSGSGLGGSSDSILSGSASSLKPPDESSGGPRSGLLSSSTISSPSSSPPQSPVSFSSVHSGSREATPGWSGPIASGPSGSDSYSESPLHSWSGSSGRSLLSSGLGGSSDSMSSGKSSKSKQSLSDDSGVSWAKVGLDGSSHSLLSNSGTQSKPSLLSSGGRSRSGGSKAAFGSSSGSMSPGKDSDSNASIRSFSGYAGSNGPSSVSILGSSVVPSSSSPRSKTPGHSSPIHSVSRMSSWGPRKTSAPGPSDSGSHPVSSTQSASQEGVPSSVPPVTTPVVRPVTKPTTFLTPSYASSNNTDPLSTFDLRMRRWHDVKSRRVPGGRSKPAASSSGLDGSSSLSSPLSPSRTKSSQNSPSDHARSGESILGVNGSPSSVSPDSRSPSQPAHQPPSEHPRSSRPNRKEEVGSSGSDSNEELGSSSSDSRKTSSGHLAREKSVSSEATPLLNGPVGSTSSDPILPRESSVESPSAHSSASSSTESSGSSSKTNMLRHSPQGLPESCSSVAPALSSNHQEEVPPPEPPAAPSAASQTPSTKPVSGGSYLDALSSAADSVEPTSFGHGTKSKVESNSAKESGYLSGLARGTPRGTSPTLSYTRSTNPALGDSYLEALSGPRGSVPGDTIKSPSLSTNGQSKPVAVGPARGNNDLASCGSGSNTKMFRHSSSGLSERHTSVAPHLGSTHPGEVPPLSEPTETPPSTSPTPDNEPVSRDSYLDALSGPGDCSLESAQHGRGTISKQASNSAGESGYSSQLAQGIPPATSLTPTYSTLQSTHPVFGGSYLDALSNRSASKTGDAIQSASFGPDGDSMPVVSSPAQGSNDLESWGSGPKTRVFCQSASDLSQRSSSSVPALTSNHPEEVLPPKPRVTSPATSLTPHSEPASGGSYLDALSGAGDDSVESNPHGHGIISEQASNSARESGYLSGLAQGTPPATSLTPTYSTSRRTNAVSGGSYLEALSDTSGSSPGDTIKSSSKPFASNRERGYLSRLGKSSSLASQSYSARGPVERSGSPSVPTCPPVVSTVAPPVVSPVTPASKSVYPPGKSRPAGDPNPAGSYLGALADPGGRLDPLSNWPSDGSKPDASSPAPEKSYSSGSGTASSSAGRRNGTPVPEQSSYSRPLVAPPALSFVTPPIDRRTAPPATSGGSPAGSSSTTKRMVGNSYLDALADQQGSFKSAPSGVKPVGVGLPPRTKYSSELWTNSPFASQPYSSPVSPQATNSDPYRVDPTVAPPTPADENAPPPPGNRFPGQS